MELLKMNNRITIHQPNYMPYLGFFDKVKKSDIFIILDNVQFIDSGFEHRNKIKTKDGMQWLTVPVRKNLGQPIKDVETANQKWQRKHWRSIELNYHKSPNWEKYYVFFEEYYRQEYKYLIDATMPVIEWFMDTFKLRRKIIMASELLPKTDLKSTELLVELVKRAKGTTYLSGKMGKDYLNESRFEEEDIKLEYQNFQHPSYVQQFGNFIPNLSALDYLFNAGDAI